MDVMIRVTATPWDSEALASLVARRGLPCSRRLTVAQLRIATIPRAVGREREGAFDLEWLSPLPSRPAAAR